MLLALALAASMGTAPTVVPRPAPPAEPTPWARAGARPFAVCREADQRAALARQGQQVRGGPDDEPAWRRRAATCPHAPHVLVEAAELELAHAGGRLRGVEGWGSDADALETAVREHGGDLLRALGWLDDAIAECDRRGVLPPREALFYRAYALAALGRMEAADDALHEAERAGDVQGWRADRMAAVIAIAAGDLETARRRIASARLDTPPEERLITRYMAAFVFDRLGAAGEASEELRALRQEIAFLRAREAVESALPVYERLYLRALDATANGDDANGLRLWDMYLARPEPQEPERVSAQRHRRDLLPSPPPLGTAP